MTKKTLLQVLAVPAILAVGFLAMQALGSTEKESKKRDRTDEARAVETRLLSFGDVQLQVTGNGAIESERTLNRVSEATGRVTFAKNDLKDGTFVRKGELVVKIDARDVENELYGMRADFLNAVASVLPRLQLDDAEIWRKWFDYFRTLDIDEPVPELPRITNPQEKIKISSANVIGLYYEVKNQEIQLSKHTVRAPFDGYLSSAGVIENSFVTQGQQLFTLSDARNLRVAVPLLVDETENIDFSGAPRAEIYPDDRDNRMKVGRITRKRTSIDRNSQSLQVYVAFRNEDLDPYFLPGNYVRVEIDGRTLHDVTTVPRHLIDADDYMFTFEEDGTLGRQKVQVVAHQGDMAVIKNTVPDNTVLVTTILQKPLVGMSIRSVNMPELMKTDKGELAAEDEPRSSAEGEGAEGPAATASASR